MSILNKIQKIEELPARLKNLYTHYIIRNIGFGLLTLFGPIFLYKLGGSLEFVIYTFLIIGVLYVLFLPLWVKLLKFFSMHIFLIIGTIFSALYLYSYYLLSQQEKIVLIFLGLLILSNVLYRLFYWIPYHVDFVRFVDKHHKGRRISYLWIIISLISIILPVFSAFIINRFGFNILFIFGVFIILISILPALFISHTRERYSFGYFESFKKLLGKKHFKSNLAYFADGWQSGIGYYIWAVFIFIILNGQYMKVGLISGAIILVTCILRFIIGEITDKFDKKKLIKTGSVLYALGWIFKAIVSSAFHIFLAGTYHSFVKIIMRTPFDALMYEIAADQGHYVDEFSVLREMSLHIGRVVMLIMALLIINYVGLIWIFVMGAVVSLLLNLVTKEEFIY